MSKPSSAHVTELLEAAASGNSGASERLLPLVYDQLRVLAEYQMAREPAGQTLQPTALVHEAYLQLVGSRNCGWDSKGHFFGAAARAMRQILVNRALKRRALKHGGDRARASLTEIEPSVKEPDTTEMLALDEALKKLEQQAPRQAQVVMLRYFSGLSVEETAQALNASPRTVKRDWRFAKAWLYSEMS